MEQQLAETGAGASVEKRRRQEKTGVVVRAKMQKTVLVEVERLVMHPLYQKYLRRRSRFMAHDEKNECRPGDRVTIRESRPLSRHKRWVVLSILERAGAR
jgi:small subunit ribosomal protein S17